MRHGLRILSRKVELNRSTFGCVGFVKCITPTFSREIRKHVARSPSFILLKLNLALRLKKVEAPARAPEFYFIKIKSCSEAEKSRGVAPNARFSVS